MIFVPEDSGFEVTGQSGVLSGPVYVSISAHLSVCNSTFQSGIVYLSIVFSTYRSATVHVSMARRCQSAKYIAVYPSTRQYGGVHVRLVEYISDYRSIYQYSLA